MRKALIQVTGLSDYCQSRFHGSDKLNKETADAYEQRTWRNKAHINRDGFVYIPGLAFKKCIAEAAKYLSLSIPGKGKSTYTKHFQSGVLVFGNPVIYGADGEPIHKDDIDQADSCYRGETLFVPASGVAGDGKRVHRTFPVVSPGWTCEVEFIISDDIITQEVFEQIFSTAGMLIGVGSFRVRNQGVWGTFRHKVIEWQNHVPVSELATARPVAESPKAA